MSADHHDFIFQLRIGAGQLGNDVVGVAIVVVVKGRLQIHAELNGDLLLQHGMRSCCTARR